MVESSWDGGGCGVEWSQGELSYNCSVRTPKPYDD